MYKMLDPTSQHSNIEKPSECCIGKHSLFIVIIKKNKYWLLGNYRPGIFYVQEVATRSSSYHSHHVVNDEELPPPHFILLHTTTYSGR
jgi:hypothetical protein